MRTLRDTTIENRTILVSDKEDDAYAALGPNLVLRQCTLILRISPKQRSCWPASLGETVRNSSSTRFSATSWPNNCGPPSVRMV